MYTPGRERTWRRARERANWRLTTILNPGTFVLRSSRGVRYEFRTTGTCVPQQWEASVDGRSILYARCRGGCFSAHYYPNGDLNQVVSFRQVRHLLMELYFLAEGDERVPGTELEHAEEAVDGLDSCFELQTRKSKMTYLRRAIDLCDQWRLNDAAGVQNVSPYSHREEFYKRTDAMWLAPAAGAQVAQAQEVLAQ